MDEEDIKWLQQEIENESKYDIFYSDIVKSIWVSIIYIKNKDIIHIKRFNHSVIDSSFKKNELNLIISKYRMFNKDNYKFDSMSICNPSFSVEDIINNNFMSIENFRNNHFISLDYLDDIVFNNTIKYFNDKNEVYLVLEFNEHHSNTKKNKLNHSKHNKTRKKC